MAPQRIHVKGYDKGTATKWMKPSPFVTVPIIFHITYIMYLMLVFSVFLLIRAGHPIRRQRYHNEQI